MEQAVYEKLSNPFALAIFILTLVLPVAIGFVALLRTRNQSDFFVGGKSMNAFVVGLSAVSSGRSSWLFLGLSGMAYTLGIGAVWAIVGYIAVEAWQFMYLGKRLRNHTQDNESITLLDYFAQRFDDKSGLLRITGVVIIGVFITSYVASQFNAGAKSLSAALDIPLSYSLVISALLILVYMVLGGYVAVAYNDVVRAFIMLLGLVILPVVGLIHAGGIGAVKTVLNGLNPKYLNVFSLSAGAIIGFLGIGLGSPGQPHIVVRYMSINDPMKLKYSALIGTIWNIILGIGAVCIGLVGRVLVTDQASLPGSDPEMIYLVLSSEHFGPVLYGLLIGGVFAAILSTADSQLLVVASTVARDLFEKIIYKSHPERIKNQLLISRIALIFSAIIALFLAFMAQDLVFWLVLFAWGGLGASFGPALILSLYWPRSTKQGIFAGMIGGALITIAWRLWLKPITGMYELIPGFIAACLIIVLVSLFNRSRGHSGIA